MRHFFSLALLILITFGLEAQEVSVEAGAAMRTINNGEYLGTFQPKESDPELMPEFKILRNKVNKSQNQEELLRYKDSLNRLKVAAGIIDGQTANKTTGSIDPIKTFGFNALGTQGTPSDNTIAVGNNGMMIAAVNSSLRVYSTSGGVIPGQGVKFFALFWNDVTTKTNLCDPLVYFDTDYDRFIVFTQICDRGTLDNRILVAFSATSDPTGPYHYYSFRSNLREVITGYPVDVWFDYPKMAVSASDVFITGNMFRNTSSTSSSFVESAVFQIDKASCFAGSPNPNAVVFNNVAGSPFTIVPAGHGQDDNYGDVMHMCATRNSTSANIVRMYTVTGKVSASPTLSTANVSVPIYSQPADGVQPGTNVVLNSGDMRGMSAFYVDGTVHLVYHSNGPGGYIAINYNRFRRSGTTWSVQNKLISFAGVDCAFPSVASMGTAFNDQSALIVFNYTSLTSNPGIRTVFVDPNMNVSNYEELNTGGSYVDYIVDNGKTRWGDYSGIAREHNASRATVWGFGMYGNSSRRWSNYISKIEGNAWPLEVSDVEEKQNSVNVFPNPVVDVWSIELELKEKGNLAVQVFDLQGKKIQDIFEKNVGVGQSLFSFNKNGLANGTYLVKVLLNDNIISNEKIVVSK